jgi:hypothetical protein
MGVLNGGEWGVGTRGGSNGGYDDLLPLISDFSEEPNLLCNVLTKSYEVRFGSSWASSSKNRNPWEMVGISQGFVVGGKIGWKVIEALGLLLR